MAVRLTSGFLAASLWLLPGSLNAAEHEAAAEAAMEEPAPAEEREKTEETALTEPAGEGEGTEAPPDLLERVDRFIASREIDRSRSRWREELPPPPLLSFEPDRRYLWELDTSTGPLVIRLFHEVAPVHVSSTIYLTRLGFYDSLKFHRIITGFMAQGGDPIGNGTGGPGFSYGGEFKDSVSHDRPGLLSMANSGPGTDGSQFFITFAPTPHLDGKHTIFGEVVGGRRTLERLEAAGSRSGRPDRTVEIRKATIGID